MRPLQIGFGARSAAMGFVLVTLVLDAMAMGIVVPVGPQLIATVGRLDEARTSIFFGLFTTGFAAAQLVAGPIQGALSDRFGRRPLILLSNAGLGFDYLIMATAPNLAILSVGRLVSGLCAGSIAAASAYVSDVTPADQRAKKFAYVRVALGAGLAIGPLIGGILGIYSPRAPFAAAAALSLLNFFFGLVILPESHDPETRSKLALGDLSPVAPLLYLLRRYRGTAALAAVVLLFGFAGQGLAVIPVLYTTYKYHWTPAQVGGLMTAVQLGVVLVQVGLTPIALDRYGARKTLIYGVSLQLMGGVLLGWAPTGSWYWFGCFLQLPGSCSGPALQGLISQFVTRDDQGKLWGAISSLTSLTAILGPAIYTALFSWLVALPAQGALLGLTYYLSSALAAAGVFAAAHLKAPSASQLGAPEAA